MKWLLFLHFYQPFNQQEEILNAIVNQSYTPLFNIFSSVEDCSLTVNVSGALLEVLDKFKLYNIIDNIRKLVSEGKLELTGSAKYHAFLPLISEDEVIRQ